MTTASLPGSVPVFDGNTLLPGTRGRCWKAFREANPGWVNPNLLYERVVEEVLDPSRPLLDAGCGRTMVHARLFAPLVPYAIAYDRCGGRVPLRPGERVRPVDGDLHAISLPANSVGTVISRSTLEHVDDPGAVFAEFRRVLVPGGRVVALTPCFGDYASLVAWLTPYRFHRWFVPRVVSCTGADVFPTYYRANTRRRVRRLAAGAGLEVERLDTLSHYPVYLMFSEGLFRLGMAYHALVERFDALADLRGWILVVLRKPVEPSGSLDRPLLP